MGLTSGQGRLLMLTSRLSDIQLDEILISQRQNQLAWQSEKVAKEYSEKTSNTKLVMKVYDKSSETGYTKKDITYSDMTSMGYLVTDSQNRIYLTKENGEWVVPKADRLDNTEIFSSGVVKDPQTGEETITLKNKQYKVVDGTEILSNKTKLQNNIMNGVMYVMNTTAPGKPEGIEINNLEANTSVEWVQDTSDDAEAESKYNYETARIAHMDNELDMQMKQLETQHEAIIKEIESVQKVIDDNIERTFKLFEGG